VYPHDGTREWSSFVWSCRLELQIYSATLELATHSLGSHEHCRIPQWPLHLALGVAAVALPIHSVGNIEVICVAAEQFRVLSAPNPDSHHHHHHHHHNFVAEEVFQLLLLILLLLIRKLCKRRSFQLLLLLRIFLVIRILWQRRSYQLLLLLLRKSGQ